MKHAGNGNKEGWKMGVKRKQSDSETEKQLDVIAHKRLHFRVIMSKTKIILICTCIISFIAALSRVIHYEQHEIN